MHTRLTGNEMIADALKQMISHTQNSVELHKQGIGEYEMCSARGVLYTLGYNSDDAHTVLKYIHEDGFAYCLDFEFPSQALKADGETRETIYPDQQVCYWGADQLHSRLMCVTMPRAGE